MSQTVSSIAGLITRDNGLKHGGMALFALIEDESDWNARTTSACNCGRMQFCKVEATTWCDSLYTPPVRRRFRLCGAVRNPMIYYGTIKATRSDLVTAPSCGEYSDCSPCYGTA
jgi:hypothetical protein